MIMHDARKRMTARVVRLGLAFVALLTCVGVQPSSAQTGEPCTYGGAQALLQAAPIAATQSDRSDRPHLGQLWDECQFRLYRDKETVTFREGDYFLGAIAVWWSYEEMDEFGWNRDEAIDDLELVTDRIEIAVVTERKRGPFESVSVIVTQYRDAQLFGSHIVFNQRGFIAQFPAGEYLVRWTQSYPGSSAFPACRDVSTVRLVVTPV